MRLYRPGPEVIKLFSCSTQLSIKYFLIINDKIPTIVGILTFLSRKNSILGLSEPKTSRISRYLNTNEHLKFHAQMSMKEFITSGPGVSDKNDLNISVKKLPCCWSE